MTTVCRVPGCTRVTKLDLSWFFCGPHWRMTPPALRLVRRRLRKRYRDRGELVDRKGFGLCTTDRCFRAFCGLNRRILKAVNERAAGIA